MMMVIIEWVDERRKKSGQKIEIMIKPHLLAGGRPQKHKSVIDINPLRFKNKRPLKSHLDYFFQGSFSIIGY
jgi:hypothetical protein